jgi:hypothetical protein
MDYFIKLWILGSAACVAAGWILSGLHALNLFGYLVFFLLLAGGWGAWLWRESGRCLDWRMQARRHGRRFRRALPLIFAVTALLAALGGALYAPNNYDALTYRVPRMLHWWSASGWHWIATPNPRMNNRSMDFEWLTMPLLVFTHSDRFFSLINVLGYLFMPGLIFAVFIRLGVAARVAWNWMWLLPMGYCYVMQAGSIGNDTIAVVYVLAALYFSLQACNTGRNGDLWLAILSVGLSTGIKGTNLPLVLPMAWGVLLAARRIRIRIFGTAAIVALALLASFVPTAVANYYFTGDWSGHSEDQDFEQMEMRNPLVGILGNSFELLVETAAPPILPGARVLENGMWRHLPGGLVALLRRDFPHFDPGFGELPQEEASGLGLGIGCAVAAALLFSLSRPKLPAGAWRKGCIIGGLAWISLLYFMMKLGAVCPGRLVSAFYPLLLIPILIFPANRELVGRRWWKALAVLAGIYALTALLLTPSRPLWPASRCLGWLCAKFPRSAQLTRAREVYGVYRQRSNLLGSLANHIPTSVSIVGLIEGSDDSEVSLWYPFGSRKVRHLVGADRFQRPKMEWVVVKDNLVAGRTESFDDWLRRGGGAAVADEMITSKVITGPEKWSVVRFQPSSE